MSEHKDVQGDDRLPEPGQSKLPLSPDEIERHHVLPGWEGHYTAPSAGSTADPLDRPSLQPDTPGLIKPPSPGRPGDRLKIAPGVLKKAAGQLDDIYDAFYKPAASLEGPASKAVRALGVFESALAIQLAHRQWERQAGTVTAWLAHIAESLRSSDGTYTRTDVAVGQTANQVRIRSALEDY
ncbi:hypothetical protein GCM10010503_00850 [Streptomyces lucensis JCM 4490]|uniref:Uncharacterized protein n=1 Tax=Streptomyces lucensis JCM 4490 TaxID=1306176 RepID=A0A918IRK5_9ACTN|nr:hypothetical protein [Streptomyces lucensis]GGW29238.1 hypothetical protein GCM10010503_00850 [Streptomyces lucensis JCM 4490]